MIKNPTASERPCWSMISVVRACVRAFVRVLMIRPTVRRTCRKTRVCETRQNQTREKGRQQGACRVEKGRERRRRREDVRPKQPHPSIHHGHRSFSRFLLCAFMDAVPSTIRFRFLPMFIHERLHRHPHDYTHIHTQGWVPTNHAGTGRPTSSRHTPTLKKQKLICVD